MDQRGAAALEWLEAFASAVREQDFARGRTLFATDVVGYGTRTEAVHGLDGLVEAQWTPVWTSTTDFRFDTVDLLLEGDEHCVVAARWTSSTPSGRRREGRCTLVLGGEPLRCRHSHFSLRPRDGGQLDDGR
jgi:ketosteroid isomerase-like protein